MGKRVLLADDSATIQKLVEMALSDTDYDLTSVSDGQNAVDLLEEVQPDIILADAIMPMLDGYEVCRAVKSNPRFSHIPVVLLTGRFQPFDENRARSVEIDERVVKPFSQEQLISMIDRYVDRDQPMPQMVPEMAGADVDATVSVSPDVLTREAAEMRSADAPVEFEDTAVAEPLDDEDDFLSAEDFEMEEIEDDEVVEMADSGDPASDSNDFSAGFGDDLGDDEPLAASLDAGIDDSLSDTADQSMPVDANDDWSEPEALADDETDDGWGDTESLPTPTEAEFTPVESVGEEALPQASEAAFLPSEDLDEVEDDPTRDAVSASEEIEEAREAGFLPYEDEKTEDVSLVSAESNDGPIEFNDAGAASGNHAAFGAPVQELGEPLIPADASEDDTMELTTADLEEAGLDDLEDHELEEIDAAPSFADYSHDDPGIMDLDEGDLAEEHEDSDLPEEETQPLAAATEENDYDTAPVDRPVLDEQASAEFGEEDVLSLDEAPAEAEGDVPDAVLDDGEPELESELTEPDPEFTEPELTEAEPAEAEPVYDELDEDSLDLSGDDGSMDETGEVLDEPDELEIEEIEQPLLADEVEEIPAEEEPLGLEEAAPFEETAPAEEPLEEVDLNPLETEVSEESPLGEFAGGPGFDEPFEPAEDNPLDIQTEELDTEPVSAEMPLLDEVEEPVQPEAAPVAVAEQELAAPAPVAAATTGPIAEAMAEVAAGQLTEEQMDEIADRVADRVLEKLVPDNVREIVWQVVPELAEAMIKKRIYELEQSVEEE